MTTETEPTRSVVVWFEDHPAGRVALRQAFEIAELSDARLTVVAVATLERLTGCGRCRQASGLWNVEMKRLAVEALDQARRILDGAEDVAFLRVIGKPADALVEAAARAGARTVVVPWERPRRFARADRRNVSRKVAERGPWQVIVAPDPAHERLPAAFMV